MTGMSYNPLTRTYRLTDDASVNYLAAFTRNERDARVSIHHCVACGLLIGTAGVAEFERATVFRPDLAKLREKVRAELDSAMPDGAARVSIRLASGETLTETVMSPRGSLDYPLADRDIEAKLRVLQKLGHPYSEEDIAGAAASLEGLRDMDALIAYLQMLGTGFDPAAHYMGGH